MAPRWLVILSLVAATALAHTPGAPPPDFTEEDREPFAGDAFAQLQGDRPEPPAAAARAPQAAATAEGGASWGDLIDADVLETEVKRQAALAAKATRSATAFKAGSYREASDALAVAAAAFAIIAEHPEEPRWRDAAAALRDHFAAGATAADAATDEAFAVASGRAADLEDLVRGGRPEVAEATGDADWSKVASRGSLMRRMYVAEEERLKPWVASERDLRKNAEGVRHEAQLLRALAEASIQPGADDGDDPDYQAFARQLQAAALQMEEAATREDQPAASAAMGGVAKSCMDCHAEYKG